VKTDARLQAKAVILKNSFHLEANYFVLEKWGTPKSKEETNWGGRGIQRRRRCWFAWIQCCSQCLRETVTVRAGAEPMGRALKHVVGEVASSGDLSSCSVFVTISLDCGDGGYQALQKED